MGKISLLSILLFGLSGCGNYTDLKPIPEVAPPQVLGEGPLTFSFETIKSVVFQSASGHCLDCHSAARGNRGGINLETFANVQPILKEIQVDIEFDLMPRTGGPLGAYEKRVLFEWLAINAPEVSDIPIPPKPSTPAP